MKKMQLTTEQRLFLVRKYYETKNFAQVQAEFRVAFPQRHPSGKVTLQRNMTYQLNGTSLHLNKNKTKIWDKSQLEQQKIFKPFKKH